MEDLLKPFLNLTRESSLRLPIHAVDVLLVAYVVYRLLALIRGTRGWRISLGIVVFALAIYFSSVLHLDTLHWLLDKAALLLPVALVILFLPELRQAIELLGPKNFASAFGSAEVNIEAQTIEEIVAAAAEMSASRVGALMVLEKTAPLSEIISNGVQLDAKVSAALLGSIFYEGNPLHDGAVVVRGNVIVAAACRLPLSDNPRLDASMHMRHRAAIGIAEMQDCVVVVISEERGSISVAAEGKLQRLGSPSELRDVLNREFRPVGRKANGRRKVFAKGKQLK